MGKGEIARDEQFLLFPSVFKRLVWQTCENQDLFLEGDKTSCDEDICIQKKGLGVMPPVFPN